MKVRLGHVIRKISLFSAMAVLLFSAVIGLTSQIAWAEQGNFTRHPTTPGSGPQFIATGPDGALWTTLLDNRIARVTTDHVLTYITVTDMSNGTVNLAGITAGPDGNMWVAEQGANNIDRITMDGVVTRFPMSDGGLGAPAGIVTGPDGNLWFAATNGVGMITTDGVVTSYPFIDPDPDLGSSAYDIAVGHDGNLWVVEQNANRIARVTTDGVITEFEVPTPGSRPTSITRGFDGNMWFTSLDSGRVGKITPDGVITEYTLPSQLSTPFGITRGYGQDLWIIDPNSGAVGKITPDGTVTIQPTQSPLFGSHLTTGPDGNLWFAEYTLGGDLDSVTQMIIDDIPPVLGPLPSTIREDATSLSGTINEGGSTLVLTLGNGTEITTTADDEGNFTFNFPRGSLRPGDRLSITSTDLSNNTITVELDIRILAVSGSGSSTDPNEEELANTGDSLLLVVAGAATLLVASTLLIRRQVTIRR